VVFISMNESSTLTAEAYRIGYFLPRYLNNKDIIESYNYIELKYCMIYILGDGRNVVDTISSLKIIVIN
jgi:hypothetical protein